MLKQWMKDTTGYANKHDPEGCDKDCGYCADKQAWEEFQALLSACRDLLSACRDPHYIPSWYDLSRIREAYKNASR